MCHSLNAAAFAGAVVVVWCVFLDNWISNYAIYMELSVCNICIKSFEIAMQHTYGVCVSMKKVFLLFFQQKTSIESVRNYSYSEVTVSISHTRAQKLSYISLFNDDSTDLKLTASTNMCLKKHCELIMMMLLLFGFFVTQFRIVLKSLDNISICVRVCVWITLLPFFLLCF